MHKYDPKRIYRLAKEGDSFSIPDLDGNPILVVFDLVTARRYNQILTFYLRGLLSNPEFEELVNNLQVKGNFKSPGVIFIHTLIFRFFVRYLGNFRLALKDGENMGFTFRQVFEAFDPPGFSSAQTFFAKHAAYVH
ncbi:MAG: hypothetical protein ACOZAO_00290 [Patescibacteria group bacterium]